MQNCKSASLIDEYFIYIDIIPTLDFGMQSPVLCYIAAHCKVSSFAAPPSLFSRLTAHNANNFWLNKFPIRISTINNKTDIRLSGLTKVVLYLMSLLHLIFILDLDNMWKCLNKNKNNDWNDCHLVRYYGRRWLFPYILPTKSLRIKLPNFFLLFWSQELNPPVTLKSLFKGRTRANSELKT